MKKIFTLLVVSLFGYQIMFGQTIVLQENFTSYDGTSATVPTGWTFSYNGNYTSSSYSGNSGPNSYKFGANGASIMTPQFSNADSVHFWLKGASTDATSALLVEESTNGTTWTTVTNINPIPTSGTTVGYPISTSSTYLRITYTKSAGNVAFDDFSLTKSSGSSGGNGGNGNSGNNILNYIKVYFTQPVDNSYSNSVNATYLNNSVFDTLAAYINRAKYTIDIAQYEYKTYSGDPIATALNNAYNRGVKIRYIQDGSYASQNSGVAALSSSIPVLSSPIGSSSNNYGIMHNKFVIIDEYAPDTTNAIVWTGSPDWDQAMSNNDYNNVIIFQSKVLARAYTHEFDIMWGDTTHGGTYNSSNSLFGPYKPNSGTHIFHIGGSEVDLYFSPSDGVNNQIINTITTAQTDIYCGMFTFTKSTDANDIVNQKNAGAYAAAILDQYSSGNYSPYTTILPNGLGSNFVGYVSSYYLYHNKYVVVDPSAPCSDPMVLTGSHNWTTSADTKNDENTVIVHNDTIANMYLQAFASDFKNIGGNSLQHVTNPCTTSVGIATNHPAVLNIYPNPYHDNTAIHFHLNNTEKVSLEIYNILGEKVADMIDDKAMQQGDYTYSFKGKSAGIYIVKLTAGTKTFTSKLVKY